MASEFHDLLVEHLPRMRAYAMGLTRNRSSADDLVQQTALKAWRAQEQFDPGTNFKAWIYRILRNEHISSFRGSKRPQASLDTVPEEFFARDADQETKMFTREVMVAINKLSRAHREVLLMHCAAGLSYDEIAAAIDCSVGTVKSRIWRARNEMQKYVLGTEYEAPPKESNDDSVSVRSRKSSTDECTL